jgi:gamma-glutamyl-gamma-aminobutyraldehyde dehydrogenase
MTDRTPPAGKAQLTARDLCAVAPFIDGSPISSSSESTLAVHEPATGRLLLNIPAGSSQDVDWAVRSSRTALSRRVWLTMPPSARKRTLHRWAELIQESASTLDALDAIEMGKPVSAPVFNAQSAADLVHFYAEAVDKHFGDVITSDPASTVLQTRVPRGVVAAIVPWNFPTYNAVLKVAPALAAANCVILKPSELASQSALVLAKLALEAGLPSGVLNVVPGQGETVGKALGEHPLIDMVTFTGSSAVGKLLLTYAGNSNMKVVSAECGGKSPHIVFDDGLDADSVAQIIAAGLCLNQGQVCSVGSRLLVQDSLEDVLVERILVHLEKIVVGDPQLEQTTYGPLASAVQLDKVVSYIESGTADGADLVYGGGKLLPDSGGYFIKPAVFTKVPEDILIAREEIFGPVLAVMRFRDLDEAVRLANSTTYGLAAYGWTTQMTRGFALAKALQTGLTMINATPAIGEGPGCAFSGEPHGLSGQGVEGGIAGLETYMRRQTTWFNHG